MKRLGYHEACVGEILVLVLNGILHSLLRAPRAFVVEFAVVEQAGKLLELGIPNLNSQEV
jgi:hypothetical protein